MGQVTLLVLLGTLAAALVPAIIFWKDLSRWFRLKKYQYEITFALYMMTPVEKFILNSIVFLILSMLLIAASLYLPEHIITMSHRAFYYWSGKTQTASTAGSAATSSVKILGSSVAAKGEHLVKAAMGMAKGQGAQTPVGGSVPMEAVGGAGGL